MQTKDEADTDRQRGRERHRHKREADTHFQPSIKCIENTVSITGPSVEFWKKFFVDHFNEQLLEKGI